MQYHLTNIVPTPGSTGMIHGLHGHAEVVETIAWGLAELGHAVTIENNSFRPGCTNIVFGAQVVDLAELAQWPPETIIYNFEQIAHREPKDLRPSLLHAAAHFQIWDFNPENINTWRRINPACNPTLVPVGWAPTLRRIPKRPDEDIDVLLYGIPGTARLRAFHDVCQTGLKCVFACGLYGASRDDLISRSKLVLNVNHYSRSHVFEIVRVSYLLANGKAVVSDIYPESVISPDLREAVAFTPPKSIPETCMRLIADDSARSALAARGQAAIEHRDIRQILRAAMKQ